MNKSSILDIKKHGQKIWLDNLSRELLKSGKLLNLIEVDGIAGLTSNPSIFYNAISNDPNYQTDLLNIKNSNLTPEECYESLVIPDIQNACDIMLPLYHKSNGEDGFVSFEVSPYLANDATGTITNAHRLWKTINRPNLMIKIPATTAGNIALTQLISDGINVNITLIFSLNQVLATWRAFIDGLNKRYAKKLSLDKIKAVASFFLSRIDTAVDDKLPAHLKGKTAITLSKTAYFLYLSTFKSDDVAHLLVAGAKPQFLLWASTGTKNPNYSNVLYVEELIGPDTINTVPDATLDEFRNHGISAANLTKNLKDAPVMLEEIEKIININTLGEKLQKDGLDMFVKSFDNLIELMKSHMPRTKIATYLSPAKLNLGLKVTNKLPNGYHHLKTIFCLIDLFDQITIQVTNEPTISLIDHQQEWPKHTDLAYRAAKLLKEFTQCSLGANITVKKIIPSGSGLGGGSSNAATVLVALNNMWQTQLSVNQLMKLGRQLGADVPFFIYGKNAIATGIGDIFTDIELPEQYFVLIKPDVNIPTKDIFTNLVLDYTKIDQNLFTAKYLLDTLDNDLLHVTLKLFPDLKNIITNLSAYGTPAMTGSGSVIYLRYNDKNTAKKFALELGKRYNTYLVKSLGFSPMFTVGL